MFFVNLCSFVLSGEKTHCFATMNALKIYIGEKPFFVVENLDKDLEQLAATHGTIMLNHADASSLKKAVDDLENSPAKAVIVLTNTVDVILEKLKTILVYIQAGGGLVQNDAGEFLFIYRRGKWDLPKGKLDEGETIEECAIREVNEETGLENIVLGELLLHTWHVYHAWGQHVLKQTSWFKMSCSAGQILTPQTEEDISETAWLKKEDWGKVLENTFPSIKDVLQFL
jgi:8-oxo-dGTP pyrophosphatase MutT (NUDIX family)